MNSCSLFGGGKYASQTEVETDVPESLERGKPSKGPAAGTANAYAATAGVPPTSNLIDSTESDSLPGEVAPPSASAPTGSTTVRGGASVVGAAPDSSRDLIDIPKPEFNDISVHNSRPPAEMLSLGPPLKPSARMSMASAPPSSKVARETVEPPGKTEPKASDLANVPKASAPAEPGVPLLHSGGSLSDFYQSIHKEILEGGVVTNTTPAVTTPPSDEALAVPPPPPADYAAPPAIPPKK
jgi:hypothetical protein